MDSPHLDAELREEAADLDLLADRSRKAAERVSRVRRGEKEKS